MKRNGMRSAFRIGSIVCAWLCPHQLRSPHSPRKLMAMTSGMAWQKENRAIGSHACRSPEFSITIIPFFPARYAPAQMPGNSASLVTGM